MIWKICYAMVRWVILMEKAAALRPSILTEESLVTLDEWANIGHKTLLNGSL